MPALLVSLAAGRNTPVEPVATTHAAAPNARAANPAPAAPYRPALDTLPELLIGALDPRRGTIGLDPPRVVDLRRLDLAGTPPEIDVVAWRDEHDRWHAATVEPERISVGLVDAAPNPERR